MWKQKLGLHCKQCAGSLTLVALANASIKDSNIQLSPAKLLEERLRKKMSEVAKEYSRRRNGKKIIYYNAMAHMAVYDGEAVLTVVASSQSSTSENNATKSIGLDQIRGKYHTGCAF